VKLRPSQQGNIIGWNIREKCAEGDVWALEGGSNRWVEKIAWWISSWCVPLVKCRKARWTGLAAGMGKNGNFCRILVQKPERKDRFEDLYVDARRILRCIWKTQDREGFEWFRNEFVLLRIETSNGNEAAALKYWNLLTRERFVSLSKRVVSR